MIQRVLIAENHSLCRAGLVSMLVQRLGIPSVWEANDFTHVLAALGRHPDIQMVVVNLDIPGMGRELGLRKLRTEHPSVLLVVVAESRAREVVLESLCAGVHGYVVKDLPADEMVRAFESILSGQIYVPALVSDISTKCDTAAAIVSGGHSATLTDRQMEVLQLVATGRSNKEIARSLYIAEGTVKVHITAAFRALGVHNRVSAAAAMHNRPPNDNALQAILPYLFSEERRGGKSGHSKTRRLLSGRSPQLIAS